VNATRQQIAELLGQGLSNRAVAKALRVRHATVGEIRRELGLPNVKPRPAACGTESGAQGHRRRREPLCDPCRHAWNKAARDSRRVHTEPDDTTEGEPRMTVDLSVLSPRERQIFHCLRRGLTAAQIAAHLDINDRTVHHHTRSLCQRLGVASRAEAALIAQAYEPRPEPAKPRRGRDWRHAAACKDLDGELFFPIGNTGPALLQIAEAKAYCNACPVREACLQYALDAGCEAGVFGGLSEDERRNLRRRNARARARAV
jgi:WhiB family redox-sensing transcriptional regulator